MAVAGSKQLLLATVLFLPFSLFTDVGLPIHDVGSLIRIASFIGILVHRIVLKQEIRAWLTEGQLTRSILLYSLIAALSATLFNPLMPYSERSLLRWFSYLCWYYAIMGLIDGKKDLQNVVGVLFISTLLVDLFGFFQLLIQDYSPLYVSLYPPNEEGAAVESWVGRIPSTFGHFNSLAGYLNLVIPFAIAVWLLQRDRKFKNLGKWCALLSTVALVFTQSRGALIAYLGTLVLAAWVLSATRAVFLKRLVIMGTGAAFGIIMVGLALERFSEVDDFTALTRLEMWGTAAVMFRSSPLVGVGFGNFKELYGNILPWVVPRTLDVHNLYLQILVETGVVGMIAFTFLAMVVIRKCLSQINSGNPDYERVVGFGVLAGFVSVLTHGTVDYLFHVSPQFSALFFLLLALLATTDRARNRRLNNLSISVTRTG